MTQESVHSLDPESLELFAKKGTQGGPGVPQAGLANGGKVRRIMQITRDFAQRPFAEDRIALVARKGTPVLLSTYPWVNDKSEMEIERALRSAASPT